MSKKIKHKMIVKTIGEKMKKLRELKNIPEIKNIITQKDKKGNISIIFQTKIIQSKEVLNFIDNNKIYFNLHEID